MTAHCLCRLCISVSPSPCLSPPGPLWIPCISLSLCVSRCLCLCLILDCDPPAPPSLMPLPPPCFSISPSSPIRDFLNHQVKLQVFGLMTQTPMLAHRTASRRHWAPTHTQESPALVPLVIPPAWFCPGSRPTAGERLHPRE